MQNKYYMLAEDTDNDVADLYIFGDISSFGQWYDDDPDRSAYNIVTELQAVTASNINVHINSYGGEVSEGLAIYNTLKSSGKNVATVCDGFACSAASLVFMAGSKRIMNNASLLMIHNAWTFARGNADELRKAADDIEKINQASVNIYKESGKISEEKVHELMDNDTWISPDEALEYGFATEIAKSNSEDGAQQSARDLVFQKMRQPAIAEAQEAIIDVTITPEQADEIAKKVAAELVKQREENKPQSHTDKNGWDKFFNKKGE